MVDVTIVNGVYKPTNVTVGHHPVWNCGRPLTESFWEATSLFDLCTKTSCWPRSKNPNVFCWKKNPTQIEAKRIKVTRRVLCSWFYGFTVGQTWSTTQTKFDMSTKSCIYIYIYVYICIYVYMYICVYICIYVYVYIQYHVSVISL